MRNFFRLPFIQKSAPIREIRGLASFAIASWNSSEGRSVFVLRRTALALSRPAHAGFRERRPAPFRVRAKRPTLCLQAAFGCDHEAKRPTLCHQAACGRNHESRRRRAPPTTNAPCGRREIPPRLPSRHEIAPPRSRHPSFPDAYSAQALLPCQASAEGN